METPTPTLRKQIGGAVIGIAIAVGVYTLFSLDSVSNIQGYLVNGLNTANPDRVRVSDKNIDDATLARITTRANEVAAQMSSSAISEAAVHTAAPQQPTETMQQRATDRATQRALLAGNGYKPYVPVQQQPAPIQSPIIQEVPVPGPTKTIIKEVEVPGPTKTIIKEVEVPGPTKTIIKEVQVPGPTRTVVKEVHVPTPVPGGKNLPDSGPGLMLLVVATMAAAFLKFKPDHAFAVARK